MNHLFQDDTLRVKYSIFLCNETENFFPRLAKKISKTGNYVCNGLLLNQLLKE